MQILRGLVRDGQAAGPLLMDAVLAAQAGATRILLYGFDASPGHWHPEPAGLKPTEPETFALLEHAPNATTSRA